MSYSQGQFMLQACVQEMKCPKCKEGTLYTSEYIDKYLICDQCNHVVWSGMDEHRRMYPDIIDWIRSLG